MEIVYDGRGNIKHTATCNECQKVWIITKKQFDAMLSNPESRICPTCAEVKKC